MIDRVHDLAGEVRHLNIVGDQVRDPLAEGVVVDRHVADDGVETVKELGQHHGQQRPDHQHQDQHGDEDAQTPGKALRPLGRFHALLQRRAQHQLQPLHDGVEKVRDSQTVKHGSHGADKDPQHPHDRRQIDEEFRHKHTGHDHHKGGHAPAEIDVFPVLLKQAFPFLFVVHGGSLLLLKCPKGNYSRPP